MTNDALFTYPPAFCGTPLTAPYPFAVMGAAHIHIIGMTHGMIRAGGTLSAIYEPDPTALAQFKRHFPDARVCHAPQEILEDPSVRAVLTAAVPSERAAIAIAAMQAGKDCMVDKAAATTLSQLAAVRQAIAATGQHYSIYYGESIDQEAPLLARDLVRKGVIGRLCHVDGFAPHRLNPQARAPWFFRRACTGGILTDLVCHQLHQFLVFLDAADLPHTVADVRPIASQAGNLFHPDTPELDDYGDAMFAASSGVSGYFRVDWNTPDGLTAWGDSRILISGERGTIELRKGCDVCRSKGGNHVFLVDHTGEYYENASGRYPLDYFARFLHHSVEGCRDAHALQLDLDAMELTLMAQENALPLRP